MNVVDNVTIKGNKEPVRLQKWGGDCMPEKALLRILRESKYTTVLSGYQMLEESGYPAIRDGDESYDIELKYGYSAEELLSSAFYSTRKKQFYEFYRNEILNSLEIPPGRGFYYLAELEKMGLVQTAITRRIFGLPHRAGCKNVIYLHGHVYNNYCPHCGRTYPMEYLRDAKNIPLCETCNTPVRPDICLFGEMVNNGLITRAAEEVSKADVLLILGTNMKSFLCSQLVDYYEGDKIILVNSEPHFADAKANMVIHQTVEETLGKMLEEIKFETTK